MVAGDGNDAAAIKQNCVIFGSTQIEAWFEETNRSRKALLDSANTFIITELAGRAPTKSVHINTFKSTVSISLVALLNSAKGAKVFSAPPWKNWDNQLYKEKIIVEGFLPPAEFRTPHNDLGVATWGTREWCNLATELKSETCRIKARAWTRGKLPIKLEQKHGTALIDLM